jgi:hypothetical protein
VACGGGQESPNNTAVVYSAPKSTFKKSKFRDVEKEVLDFYWSVKTRRQF